MFIGDLCKNLWTFGLLCHLPLRSPCYPTLPLKAAPLVFQSIPILQGGTFSPCNSLSGLRDWKRSSWGVWVQQTVSWSDVQNQFLGLPKTVVNFKALQFPVFSSSPFEDRQHNRASQTSCAAHFSREGGIPLSVSWLFLTLFPLRTPRWTPSGCGDLLHLSFSSYSTTSSLETSICIKATLWFSLQSAFGTGISTQLSAADVMQELRLTPVLACCTLLLTHFIWICGNLWGILVHNPA